MCGFDCPCDPKVCNGGCPGQCQDYTGTPSDADMLAYLDGQHGPPSPEALAIIQDELARAALGASEGGDEG